MRLLIFKTIAILGALIIVQGVILPWTISNAVLPVWADIIILSVMLMIWILILEYIGKQFYKEIKNESDRRISKNRSSEEA